MIQVMAASAPSKPVISSLTYDSLNEWYTLTWGAIDDGGDAITETIISVKAKDGNYRAIECTK